MNSEVDLHGREFFLALALSRVQACSRDNSLVIHSKLGLWSIFRLQVSLTSYPTDAHTEKNTVLQNAGRAAS